jgi:RNA recognition motif-containing protein
LGIERAVGRAALFLVSAVGTGQGVSPFGAMQSSDAPPRRICLKSAGTIQRRRIRVTRIYCGNLPFSTTDVELRNLFSEFGTVNDASIVSDRETGRSRGFGFVDMEPDGAGAAIEALDGKDYKGRNLKVNEARPREERPPQRNSNRNRRY